LHVILHAIHDTIARGYLDLPPLERMHVQRTFQSVTRRFLAANLPPLAVISLLVTSCTQETTRPSSTPSAPLAPLFAVSGGTSQEDYRDRYIVVLKDNLVSDRASVEAVGSTFASRLGHIYDVALKGFAATIDPSRLDALRRDPRVKYIQQDGSGFDNATDTNAGWGVGRIDQRTGPSDNQFSSNFTGQNVNIYIVDGGINIVHSDFGGRATAAATWDVSKPAGEDCTGHGTQVASVAAGAEYGVAKGANIRSVRVNGCGGAGSVSDWIWGINWVAANKQNPAILSFSKSMGDFWQGVWFSGALDDAIRGAKNSGAFVVVAAGNKNGNACGYSPSQVLEVMVVGATDQTDTRALFPDPNQPGSNYGSCIDIFAPG
jgi:aqualysin 1